MKKIGNQPITEADTDFSKMSTKKTEKNFRWILGFYAHTLAL